jgi:hypothetical protein
MRRIICDATPKKCARFSSAGQRRFLFVKVDIGKTNRALMASIGHELQHAVEVLSDHRTTGHSGMYFLYQFNRERGGFSSTSFETREAIEAGEAVADEIGRYQRSARQCVFQNALFQLVPWFCSRFQVRVRTEATDGFESF